MTGKYRGSAHQDCNINYRLTDKMPVIFNNLRGYIIMQRIGEIANKHTYKNKNGEEKRMDINVIPNNIEKYIHGNHAWKTLHLVFIYSFQFMSPILDKLVSNLPNNAFKYTSEEIKNAKN